MKRIFLIFLSLAIPTMSWSFGTNFPPNPPSSVLAIPGNGKVTVQWQGNSAATSYTIYWGTSPGITTASPSRLPVSNPASSISQDITLTNGITYYFAVTATNAFGESALSAEMSATPQTSVTPTPPVGVHAVAGNAQATVYWDPSSTAQSYNLYYRPTTPGVTKANGTRVASVSTGVIVPSLTNGLCYYFVVTSMNGSNESSESSEVCVTPTP